VTARARKRRSPGEGSVWSYKTKAGQERYAIGYVVTRPDGTRRSVTRRVGPHGEKWTTAAAAKRALRDAVVQVDKGEWADPSRQPLGAYLDGWLDGLGTGGDDDQGKSTIASYRKNVRLHIKPYLGSVPLSGLTPPAIAGLYRELQRSGRRDYKGGGLSARTVRYVHTILCSALSDAVSAGLLLRNPAADPKQAKPPTAKQAKAPEMHPWTAAQLAAFLAWSREHSDLHAAWHLLAMTGMRRGECLALRWRNIDLDGATVSIGHSVGVVRNKGERELIEDGDTKSHKPRVIDIDPGTVAVLRAWKRDRGGMALQLARDDALVFGDHEGAYRHPERFTRRFKIELRRCRVELGDDELPDIRLHDLRHTHATILLADREPIKTVSERLGHSSVVITLNTYGHVMPGDQKRAADRFAALIEGAGA
jgi:integrase